MNLQSLFHTADSPQGIKAVNTLLGKTLVSINKSQIGVLLKFDGVKDYLFVVGSKLPEYGNPKPVGDGTMEMEITGVHDVVAVSVSGAGLEPDPRYWNPWIDPEVDRITGLPLTGYSPSKSKIWEDGVQPAVLLEFGVGLFLSVTPSMVQILQSKKQVRPS